MIGGVRSLVPEFVRRSYVLKFGIALLVLGLSVGTIGFVATDQLQDRVTNTVENDLSDLAAQEATAFETWHRRNGALTETLAATVADRSGPDWDTTGYLAGRAASLSGAHAIHVVDLEGDTVTTSTGDLEGLALDQVDESWASTLAGRDDLDDGAQILGVAGTRTGSASEDPPRLVYAAPAGDGRALVYAVRVDDYESGVGQDAFAYVVDARDFSILYDSTGQSTFRAYPQGQGQADALIRASDERDGSADYDPNVGATIAPGNGSLALSAAAIDAPDERLVPSYANVDDTPYTVLVHTPRSRATGFVQTVEQWGFAVTIGGVLVIALFGLVVGYNTASAIDRLRLKSEAMERGDLDVDFETDRVDNIGRLYDSMANMRDALRSQIVQARSAREEAETARERAERTSRHLQSKANEYRDVMQAVAAGDLGQRMEPSERNEAMREIAEEFNDMIAEMERTVAQLKRFADEVAESSETVTASAAEVRSASRQVTESIREISRGADRQDDSLQSVAGEMGDFSTTVQEIAALSNEVADLSEKTARTGRRGREAAREAVEGMNQIETDSRDAVEAIERLESEVEQIDDLVEVIADLADQTNVVALNANIEASRADEETGDDDGFATVAQEIKDLASETKRAARSIEERIQRVQETTDETVASVKTTGERIADNTDSVRNAVEALDEIAEYAEQTNTGVQEISDATRQQAASTEEVVGMVDEAAAISEQTSDEAENVAAAAAEQTSAVSEVTAAASRLSEQASRLSDALGRFQIRRAEESLPDPDPDPDSGSGSGSGSDGRNSGSGPSDDD